MNAVTHLEKVITGEVSAVTHLEKVIAGETSAVTYTEKVITGEAPPITHLQKVIAGVESPVTHLEYIWAGGSPTPTEHEYTGAVPYTFTADGSPLISWRISGNTIQNGTPTPSNPVDVVGVGELETTGEHAGQYKIPILCGGTTTPVYLGEVETTRLVKKLVLTGEETWYSSSKYVGSMYAYLSQFPGIAAGSPIYCSHLIAVDSTSQYQRGACLCETSSVNLWIFDTTTSPAAFKAYLAAQYSNGTPVIIWYVLETPETAVVNEPLMKIGDYADEVSNVATIPTVNGSNTFDVDTTVKPSEVYIKYKGV